MYCNHNTKNNQKINSITGTFKGTFDGGYYTLMNAKINGTALFENVEKYNTLPKSAAATIGEFMEFLSDENGKSFSLLAENEFDDITQLIKVKS